MAKFGENMKLGIEKLFNDESLASIRNTHTVQYINIDKIEGHEKNRKYDPVKLEALALDIADLGLHTPIFVIPVGEDRYRVLSGHRRLAAFRLLVNQGKSDYQTIPSIVQNDLDEDKAEEVLIGDNAFSEPLTPAELAKELERKKELLQKRRDAGEKIPGKLTEIIAAELGIAPQTARVLDTINRRATKEIKDLFEDGEISQREAYLASRLSDKEQKELSQKKKENGSPLFPVNNTVGVVHEPPLDTLKHTHNGTPEVETADESAPVKQPKSYRITAQELQIDYGGISYLCAFGTHINGGWIAILNYGVAAELSTDNVPYNTKNIEEALTRSGEKIDDLRSTSRKIAETVTDLLNKEDDL